MSFARTLLALGSLAALAVRDASAAESATLPDLVGESLNENSRLDFDFNSRTWTGHNGVLVKQGNAVLVADEVRVDENTRQVVADGNVTLQDDRLYWTGEHLEFNFLSHEIGGGSYRAGVPGLYLQGDILSGSSTNNTYRIENGNFTTDDLQPPGYHVRAKSIEVKDGREVTARDATLFLGNTPVMYLPYYHRTLGPHPTYWVVTPGYRSLFGPFLLTSYHVNLHENWDVGMRLDYRALRGPGVGPEISYDLPHLGKGHAEYYFTPDARFHEDIGFSPKYSENRQRARFEHAITLDTNLTAKASINWQSDPLVLRDFFEWEYRTNAQPKTVFEISKVWDNFTIDGMAQPQVNPFFPTVERLPDIKFSTLRQQLGVSPFYYEGDSSFAYLRNKPITNGVEYAAMRADTYHQIVLPWTFFDFLNVTPRAGGRFTYYSDAESPFVSLEEQRRFVFNTGVETSFKASRLYSGVRNNFLDVTDLRHIIEPSANYVFVPKPNVRPGQIPQFDTEVPSLRLLPIDFPDYNQIDSIDSMNVIRLGLRNKLQTKRDGEIDNLVNWYLVTDWRLDPMPGQQTFSDIYSDLDFKPRRWLIFNSETRFNAEAGDWILANHSVTLMPSDRWSLRLGHRYFRGDPAYGPDSDNNIIYSTFYYRLNENWGARMSQHFEARDGTMEEQYYTVYRDFRSFTGAFTFRVRDQRVRGTDYTVAFTLQLKSSPNRAGHDRLEPSVLLGN